MTQMQLPAYLQGGSGRQLAQTLTANLGVGSPPYLSIMGNRFSLIDAAGEEIPVSTFDPRSGPYIDCVIIDALAVTSKIYYDKPFDPGANQYEPPACFSDNGIGPSRNAAKPQAATCATCPQSAWGSKVSAVSGKQVKACADIQKIALIVPGYDMPFLLRVPPNSRTNFRGYTARFNGQQADLSDVVTRISFEQGGIGTLKFDAVTFIDEPTFRQRQAIYEAKATDGMLGRTDLPRDAALPAAEQRAALPPPTAQAVAPGFMPAALPQQTGAAPVPQQPMQQVQVPVQQAPAQQQPAPAAQGRRRRNTAQAAPAPGPAPQQAPFMPQQAQAPAPNPAPAAQPNFGIQQGAAPTQDVQNTLNTLFGPVKT